MARLCPSVLPLLVLLVAIQASAGVKADSGEKLVRNRREWILPPRTLKENHDYTKEESIARIRSDFDIDDNIEYSLEGIGSSQMPYHVFVVDARTGNIRVTKVLDREYIAMYNLSGVAKFKDGSEAEKRIDIRIKVEDMNDCSPVFGKYEPVEVAELSPQGFAVTTVIASDDDEPGNINSKIAYSLISQEPSHNMFYILRNGTIFVRMPTLDRETADQYILTVRGEDLDGQPGGNTATGTVTINILDVNDNPPTLEKEEYEGSVMENTQGVEVMRIKAEDLDMEHTPNWEAVFDLVKGNEAGYFRIETDPETNEGILMLDKPVDYEDVKNLELGIVVRNKAPPYQSGPPIPSGASGIGTINKFKTYPIKINVMNQPEGASFDPKIKTIPISEGDQSININDVIATYPAIDGDTGTPAENIRYAKGFDPDNWLIIDPETAEIKLNKMPDRESPYLVNGTYYANVLGITEDIPAKTVTGTIAIQVEDFNDHCPVLTGDVQTICTTDDSAIVNAQDEDMFPNGPPFKFAILPEGTEGKWHVEHLNDTAAILRAHESLWPGVYEVMFEVKDEQGLACPEPQKVKVQVCTCEDGVHCATRDANGQLSKGAEFGPAGIGLLLLGLLLLLLVPLLLLFCQCGGMASLPGNFTEMPFDTKSHLMNYHTEGQGEDKDVPLLAIAKQVKVDMMDEGRKSTMVPLEPGYDFQTLVSSSNGMHLFYQERSMDENRGISRGEIYSGFGGEVVESEAGGGDVFKEMALPQYFLNDYYTQKVTSGYENAAVKDCLLIYDYEGQESSAGSVGCCSLLEAENDLQFLDQLGPKFRTLAEVCGGNTCETAATQKSVSLPTASVNTHSSVSSMITAQQLPPPLQPQLQPFASKKTMVKETSEHTQVANESTATLRQGASTLNKSMAGQGQMLLLQQKQPVYYTTTPVLQPMHYMVQPQVQNTVLLAEAPVTNMQGMVLVNSTQSGPTQGVVIQGQTVMSSGQLQGPDLMLMERNVVQGGGANLINAGNLSGSQTMMLMEGKVPSGSMNVLKGSQTCLVPGGTLKLGRRSGSQSVLVVGGPTSNGEKVVQGAGGLSQTSGISGSQRVLCSKGSTTTSSQSSKVVSSATTVSTVTTNCMGGLETRENC